MASPLKRNGDLMTLDKLFLVSAALFAVLQANASNARFEDLPQGDVILDLGGKSKTVRNWEWPGWNGYVLKISNGTLAVTGCMSPGTE